MNMGNEHNVRELAYQIWEAEGRPVGQEERHWQMAMEQAGLSADSSTDSSTTGENFLGDDITPSNESSLLQDDRQYALQNNPFEDEDAQATMDAEGMNTPQQPMDTQLPTKGGKRKGSKSKSNETLASQDTNAQDTNAVGRSKPGKRKASDNILV